MAREQGADVLAVGAVFEEAHEVRRGGGIGVVAQRGGMCGEGGEIQLTSERERERCFGVRWPRCVEEGGGTRWSAGEEEEVG